MAEYNARIRHKRDTSANWTNSDPLLLNGEIVIVDTDAGDVRYKTGDGIKKYSQLPFTDEAVYDAISKKQNKITSTGILRGDGEGAVTSVDTAEIKLVTLTASDVCAVRKNLLDNWYFGAPVNQMAIGAGGAAYASGGYCLDRWRTSASTFALKTSGSLTKYPCISISNTSTSNQYFQQRFDPKFIYPLIGQTITMSCLCGLEGAGGDNTRLELVTVSGTVPEVGSSLMNSTEFGRMDIGASSTVAYFNLILLPNTSIDVYAIKVEIGGGQTLVDPNLNLLDIPDYSEELSKCQRYYQVFATQSLRPTNAMDFRPTMRATPTLGTLAINGTTYYTASAVL